MVKINKELNSRKNKNGQFKNKRLSFPSDEKVHSWLPALLEAYHIVDQGVVSAVKAEQKKGSKKLACSKGCSHCCRTQRDIPVYPLELVGISWYVTEKISGCDRKLLMEQLKKHKENSPCPFLIEDFCLVHVMRPIGCRQFNVFGKPCAEGEDPYHTRRGDVLVPVKKHVDQAFFIMLPFYGVEKESERAKVIDNGEIHKTVRRMQDCNWKSLADKMSKFEIKS